MMVLLGTLRSVRTSMDKNILVVGATGQLGASVVRKITACNSHVRALVRRTSDTTLLRQLGVELAYGNLDDLDSLMQACKGVDAVVATASSIVPGKGDRFGERDVIWYTNLVNACKTQGVGRIVYISAYSNAYDHAVPEFQIKRKIEHLIIDSGVKHTIFRSAAFMDVYFAVMGSSIPLRGVAHPTLDRGFWMTRLFRQIGSQLVERYGFALVPGRGAVRHAFISVDNVAEFMANALEYQQDTNQVCDICGPDVLSWDEVVELFAKTLKRKVRPVHLPVPALRILQSLLGRFSPGSGNLLAILTLLGTVEYGPDCHATADQFQVRLTSAQTFLLSKLQ